MMTMEQLNWMAWTWPTFIFFSVLIILITMMTIWEIKSPTLKRKGFLPLNSTRGDRFFIGLLVSAFIFLSWLALFDQSTWGAFILSLFLFPVIMKWG